MDSGAHKVLKHLESILGRMSMKTVYVVLLLFYAYRQSSVPKWAKNIILGSFAYFLNPFDSIPDLTPFLGMTDDMGVLLFGLSTISCYINDEVREQALYKLRSLTKKDINSESLDDINAWL